MDADEKLRKRVNWLNSTGGFGGSLVLDKVMQAAFGLEIGAVMKVLKDLEEKKEQVKDPTAYVTSALRKAGGGQGGGGGAAFHTPSVPPPGMGYGGGFGAAPPSGGEDQEDKALRKRIGWLNNAGGFAGQIHYQKIIEQAKGLEYSKVFDVLKQLEPKQGQVNDPTGWVCAALRKMGGGGGGGGGNGGYGAPTPRYGYAPALPPMPMAAAAAPSSGGDADTKLRKRVEWLNTQGGFGGAIDMEKIYGAARGLEISVVMKVLKELEEKKDQVRDPNAYAGAALRKLGGGGGGFGGGGGGGGYAPPPAMQAMPPPAYGYGMPPEEAFYGGGGGGDGAAEDQKLRRRIGWMNKAGGFDGAIHYQKIIEAAKGLEYSEVMRLLKEVEEKREGIKDPTGWVVVALKKMGGGGGMMHSFTPGFPMGGGMPQMGAPAGFPPAGGEQDADTKLRKRIGWLNKNAFNNDLNYQKVSEAATGMEIRDVMDFLKDMEGKKDEIKDPTGYAVVALRKRKERAMGGMPPAKRART